MITSSRHINSFFHCSVHSELLNIRAHWNVTGYSVFGTLSYSLIMDDILGDKKLFSLYPCALFCMIVGGKWTLLVVISKENKIVSGLYSRGVNIRPTLIWDGLDQSNSASVSVKKLQLQLFFYLIKKKLLWQRQKSISTTLDLHHLIFLVWYCKYLFQHYEFCGGCLGAHSY